MSVYEVAKDFAGPAATAIAAVSAAIVTGLFAYRQAKAADLQARIALDRLKHDTFEARHDVLDACRDMSRFLHGGAGQAKPLVMAEFLLLVTRIDAGRFYFGYEVKGALKAFLRVAREIVNLQLRASNAEFSESHREADRRAMYEQLGAFTVAMRDVSERLEFDLSLNLLKEGSDLEHARALPSWPVRAWREVRSRWRDGVSG